MLSSFLKPSFHDRKGTSARCSSHSIFLLCGDEIRVALPAKSILLFRYPWIRGLPHFYKVLIAGARSQHSQCKALTICLLQYFIDLRSFYVPYTFTTRLFDKHKPTPIVSNNVTDLDQSTLANSIKHHTVDSGFMVVTIGHHPCCP